MINKVFVEYLVQFPKQINEVVKKFKPKSINVESTKINKIICIGMGGSAIAADVLKDALSERLQLPINVIRGYHCPKYCDENTLVIACSYSGNTEETLSAVKEAQDKKAQLIAISSGGELIELAKKNKWSQLTFPGNLPPRQAFGYLFFSILMVLNHLGIIEVKKNEIEKIIKLSEKIIRWNYDKITSDRILSKELARQIRNKIPIVYAPSPYYSSVALRWKSQFQENSKSMAFHNTIPEMNHNEIVGWEMEHEALKDFIVIFLQCEEMPERISHRIELTKNIIKAKGVSIAEIYAEGSTRLEKAISLILFGDWISFYLANFYNKEAISILNIDYLKSELKKIS